MMLNVLPSPTRLASLRPIQGGFVIAQLLKHFLEFNQVASGLLTNEREGITSYERPLLAKLNLLRDMQEKRTGSPQMEQIKDHAPRKAVELYSLDRLSGSSKLFHEGRIFAVQHPAGITAGDCVDSPQQCLKVRNQGINGIYIVYLRLSLLSLPQQPRLIRLPSRNGYSNYNCEQPAKCLRPTRRLGRCEFLAHPVGSSANDEPHEWNAEDAKPKHPYRALDQFPLKHRANHAHLPCSGSASSLHVAAAGTQGDRT